MPQTQTSALVTGGASGIGAAVVAELVERGVTPVVADLREGPGSEAARAAGGRYVECDVAVADDVERAVVAATDGLTLRHVVAAAGVGMTERVVDADGRPHDPAAFERILRINLFGAFDVVRLAGAAMAAQPAGPDGERGSMVMVSSIEAFDGQEGQAAYVASKAAMVGMTLPLARDLAAWGIRVNTVAPGLIDTPIYGPEEAAAAYKEALSAKPLFPRRMGTAAEVASMITACLVNPYLNAETVRIDGGIRMEPGLPPRPDRPRA